MASRCSTRSVRILTVLAPGLALLGAVALIDPGAQLERGLQTAAAAEALVIADASPVIARRSAVASVAPEEGSEAFWLTRAADADDIARVTWSAPVAPGDRVIVNFGPYHRQTLDVVAVEQAGSATTRIDTGESGAPTFVITGRKVADPRGILVRLTVDAEGRGLTMVGERTL
jgi:hypothetical protein